MELRDLIVTPIIIFLVYAGAYRIRPYLTDSITRKYFIPALTVRIIGALAVGFIYQFYYDGGDTFNFHTNGSRVIWDAFMESPITGIKLLISSGSYDGDVFQYASRIPFYKDPSSFAVIRLAVFIDLITFSSYSATAIFFAVLSFTGLWLLFIVFYNRYPTEHRLLAISCFFIPSVFFWGSGLLKDTITLTSVALVIYCVNKLLVLRMYSVPLVAILFVSLYLLYVVKIYILLILLPSMIIWIFLIRVSEVKGLVKKMLVSPLVLSIAIVLAAYSVIKAAEENPKYSIDKIAETAKITAYDIRYWTGRDAGSGYTLGNLDGTFRSLISLAPQAVNVTLFRPYLWEVNNPLMLMSAVESSAFLILLLVLFLRSAKYIFYSARDPMYVFCTIFSITFAFGVGISTFNFGTLSRYKIPLLPFFAIALVLVNYHSKRRRKFSEFEAVE